MWRGGKRSKRRGKEEKEGRGRGRGRGKRKGKRKGKRREKERNPMYISCTHPHTMLMAFGNWDKCNQLCIIKNHVHFYTFPLP